MTMAAERSSDLLEDLFLLQASLNDRIFQKRSLHGEDGNVLTTGSLARSARSGPIAPGGGSQSKAISTRTSAHP